MTNESKTILVTGGAGYVGSVLVPKLLGKGYRVRVLDLLIYGNNFPKHENLEVIQVDIRDVALVKKALAGVHVVIHLACISNDPSYELNPGLGKSINYDAMMSLVKEAREAHIERFIYASSSSVYGVKEEENVTEDLSLEPLTDYSKYKALSEERLMQDGAPYFTAAAIRSATVCGYSPRMRFDLTVNILTNHAWNNRKIVVFGGEQKRPNIHIEDITDLYVNMLEYPPEKVHKKIFNVGAKNHTVSEIADIVKYVVEAEIGKPVAVEFKNAGDDKRSYHISSEKIKRELGFTATRTVRDAVQDICNAFREGEYADSLNAIQYFNVKMMQRVNLQ